MSFAARISILCPSKTSFLLVDLVFVHHFIGCQEYWAFLHPLNTTYILYPYVSYNARVIFGKSSRKLAKVGRIFIRLLQLL